MKLDKRTMILSAALFVSLVANLFLGGMILGHHLGRAAPQDARAEWRQQRSEDMRRHLSKADEKILKSAMKDNQKKFEEMRNDLEDIRQDIKAASHAEPFDQETLDAALREENQKKKEIIRLMKDTRREVMKKLSPEGVKILQRMAPPPRFSVRRSVGAPAPAPHAADEPVLWEEWDDVQ